MSTEIGEAIITEVKKFPAKQVTSDLEKGIYHISTNTFIAEVSIQQNKELSILLTLQIEQVKKPKKHLFYQVDTDLYTPTTAANRRLFANTEAAICDILSALRTNTILIGSQKGRIAFVLPVLKEYILVSENRFFGCTARTFNSLEQAEQKGLFIAR